MQTKQSQGQNTQKEQQERLESLRARQSAKARQASEIERQPATGLQLRPYQLEAVEAACAPISNISRRLVQMATGGGKTLVIAAIIDRLLLRGQSALVLAHRDELLSQAIAEIEGFLPGVLVEREQAGNRATRMGSNVVSLFDSSRSDQRRIVVASVQSMQRQRLESFAPNEFSLVVVDKVHHAIAPSYRRIMEYFGCFDDAQRVPLIGVTATAERTDRVGLDNLFQTMSSSHGIRDLIEQGHLCTIRALSIRTETDLRGIKMTAGDYNARQLEDRTNTGPRNARIIAAHMKYAGDRPTLVFATGVDHSKELAALYVRHGIASEAIYGAMDADERAAALQRYRDGVTRVLVNYAVLTEGVNLPSTACVILARPTKSSLLVTQMLGRGTRLFEGKEDCLIIDICDVSEGKDIATAASISGLPANFDAQGNDVHKAKEAFDKLESMSPHLAAQSMTAEAVDKHIVMAIELIRVRELDLLAREERLAAQKYESRFAWYRVGDYNFEISPDAGSTYYQVFCDLDDVAAPWCIAKKANEGEWEDVGTRYSNAEEAISLADAHISSGYRNTALIDLSAPWMQVPATEKQLWMLKKKFREPTPPGMTKGQASVRLNVLFAQSRQYAA